jgi:hypothetical protein
MDCHEEDCQWYDWSFTDCCTFAGNDELFVYECPIRKPGTGGSEVVRIKKPSE